MRPISEQVRVPASSVAGPSARLRRRTPRASGGRIQPIRMTRKSPPASSSSRRSLLSHRSRLAAFPIRRKPCRLAACLKATSASARPRKAANSSSIVLTSNRNNLSPDMAKEVCALVSRQQHGRYDRTRVERRMPSSGVAGRDAVSRRSRWHCFCCSFHRQLWLPRRAFRNRSEDASRLTDGFRASAGLQILLPLNVSRASRPMP